MRLVALAFVALLVAGCSSTREDSAAPSLSVEQKGDSTSGVATFDVVNVSAGLQRDDLALRVDNASLQRAVDCAVPAPHVWSWCAPPGVTGHAIVAGGEILVGGARANASLEVVDSGRNVSLQATILR